ncbi:thioredoxin-like protein [Cystobasidium minutum MCA 4210]|uniref:thioredoxin-like protein n=1 Tax=Cystobasidium minutum MCA 4210 TaxID=1397322 RepID=UPI0034CD519F|eukprot:jgi/Rhomi1/19408/CE19407_2079
MASYQDILTDAEDVKQVIAKATGPSYVMYYADWCPDCQNAAPILEKTFGNDKAPRAARVMVGERPLWKSSGNVFRQDPFKISNIPTLVRIEQGSEVGRLTEGEILDQERLAKFIA